MLSANKWQIGLERVLCIYLLERTLRPSKPSQIKPNDVFCHCHEPLFQSERPSSSQFFWSGLRWSCSRGRAIHWNVPNLKTCLYNSFRSKIPNSDPVVLTLHSSKVDTKVHNQVRHTKNSRMRGNTHSLSHTHIHIQTHTMHAFSFSFFLLLSPCLSISL